MSVSGLRRGQPRRLNGGDVACDEEALETRLFWEKWGREAADALLKTVARDETPARQPVLSARCGTTSRFHRHRPSVDSVSTHLSLLSCSTGAAGERVAATARTSTRPGRAASTRPDCAERADRWQQLTARLQTTALDRLISKDSSALEPYLTQRGPPSTQPTRAQQLDDVIDGSERRLLRDCSRSTGLAGRCKAVSVENVHCLDRDAARGAATTLGTQQRCRSAAFAGVCSNARHRTTSSAYRKPPTAASRSGPFGQPGYVNRDVKPSGGVHADTLLALERMTGVGDGNDVIVKVDDERGRYVAADYAVLPRYPQNIRVARQLSDIIRKDLVARMGRHRNRDLSVKDLRVFDTTNPALGRSHRNLLIFSWLNGLNSADWDVQ